MLEIRAKPNWWAESNRIVLVDIETGVKKKKIYEKYFSHSRACVSWYIAKRVRPRYDMWLREYRFDKSISCGRYQVKQINQNKTKT